MSEASAKQARNNLFVDPEEIYDLNVFVQNNNFDVAMLSCDYYRYQTENSLLPNFDKKNK